MHRLRVVLATTCALGALGAAERAASADAGVGPAQNAGAPVQTIAANSPVSSGTASVQELVVTAQMREQQVKDVPISMNVVSGGELRAFTLNDVRSLQNNIPGLFVQTSPTNNGLYLRGFGSSPANPAFDQSVSLYEDGIYAGRTRQFMAPFLDVARIEVLRGPQGALLGKNTAAGAISIVTNGPTSTFQAGATADYNVTLNGVDAEGFVSGPLDEHWSGRLAVKLTDLDGFFHNVVLDENQPAKQTVLGRGSLRYENGPFDVTTKFEYGYTNVNGNSLQYVPQDHYQDLSETKYAGRPFGQSEFDRQYGYQSSTTANLKLGDYTVTSITGFSGFSSYTDSGAVGLDPENFLLVWHERYNQQSEEIRLISPKDRRLDFILGAYVDHSDDNIADASRYLLFGFLNGQQTTAFTQEEESWSLFGIGTWHITDSLRLLANARYTGIHKHGQFYLSQDYGIPLPGTIPGNRQDEAFTESHVDPAVTAQWDATRDLMLYATFAEGSKAGGFDPTNGAVTPENFQFRPERSTNYEVGGKWSFARRALLTLAAYQLDFKNLQVASYVPPEGLQTTNAGRARSQGIEFTLAWRPIDRLQISAAGAYMDAKYLDFPGAQCRATQPLSECDPSAPPSAPNSELHNNAKGVPLNFAPRYSYQLQADYTQPLGDGLDLTFTVLDAFRSRVWVDSAYNPNFGYQPPVHKVDARVAFGPDNQRWSLALVGKNLGNEITRSYAFAWPLELGPGSTPVAGVVAEEGRTVAIQGTINLP